MYLKINAPILHPYSNTSILIFLPSKIVFMYIPILMFQL